MTDSAPGDGIKTRILILSDTHGTLPLPAEVPHDDDAWYTPYKHPLPKADILIHCGDLTMNGHLSEHQRALELIKSVDAPLKIVIPGNHDLTLDRDYYDKHWARHTRWKKYTKKELDEIEGLYTGAEAREHGIVFIKEGTQTIQSSNGAEFTVYASAWTPEFCGWGFAYDRDEDRFSPGSKEAMNPVSDEEQVDIMVTHGPPMGVLDETIGGEAVGCEHLKRAVVKQRPRLHCFGHIHEGWGALWKKWDCDGTEGEIEIKIPSKDEREQHRGVHFDATGMQAQKETLFVNASVMSVRYQPVQAPWIVDILLARAKA